MARYRDRVTQEYVDEAYAREHPDQVVLDAAEEHGETDPDSDLGVLRDDAIPE